MDVNDPVIGRIPTSGGAIPVLTRSRELECGRAGAQVQRVNYRVAFIHQIEKPVRHI